MKRSLLAFAALSIASVITAASLAARRAPQEVHQQERAGADSARVVRFLDALASADPLLCEMVSDQIGNFWWSDANLGIGRVADSRAALRAAKDSMSRRISDPAAIRVLSTRIGSEDPCIRLTAAKLLGNSAVTDDALVRLLDDASPRVREAVLRAVGEHDRPALRTRVERLLTAREGAVVAMAAWALGELDQRSSLPPLRRALSHDDAQVRVAAAWALGEIDDPAAVADLESRVADDSDRRVRLAAIEALGELQQHRSLDVLSRVVSGGDIELAIAAVDAIGELDDIESAPPALVRALESPNVELRYSALRALTDIQDESLAPALLPYVTDANAEIRAHVIEALGELRARIAIPALKRALTDPNPEVRRAAIEALAEIEDH